jgi:hypothetical protein
MHRSTTIRGSILAALLIALAEPLAAKAPTVRLTIAGPGLAGSIETTEPKALASVWAGNFIAGPAEEPDTALPRYTITFYVRWVEPGRETIRPMYAVRYVRDPRSNRGFVYLPGRGEEGYALNASAMLRDGQDGRWHYASQEWSDAVARTINPTPVRPAESSAPCR